MSSLFRDTGLGHAIRLLSNNKWLKYPDEHITFEDQEKAIAWQETYCEDLDVEMPLNWSMAKKIFVSAQICLYTFVIYSGSSIIVASTPFLIVEYGISEFASSFPLALYVLGYGLGAMLFSPMSEISKFGRNIPYLFSMTFFVIFSATAATCQSFSALLAWRFLQGFCGSPALASGGASMRDMFSIAQLPFAITAWIFAAVLGPSIAPVVATYSVSQERWRWPLYMILWSSLFTLLVLYTCLPETLSAKITYARQQRLHRNLPPGSIASPDAGMPSMRKLLEEALIRPTKIMLTNPAIAFANFFTCIIYGLYYSFFESFPRIFMYSYHFTLPQIGLACTSIAIGGVLGVVVYLPWALKWLRQVQGDKVERAEDALRAALPACFLVPVGLFVFAWTSNATLPWPLPLLGVILETAGIFVILQCLSIYIILAYPSHAASLFAGNDCLRSTFAFAAILFSKPMYDHLGVAVGVSILASLTVGCCAGMWGMWAWGHKLRPS